MSETKNVYQRLALVKEIIVGLELTKEGINSAINRKIQDKNGRTTSVAYSYFTLESLIPIVTTLSTQNGLLTNFLLLEDSFGLYGLLTITNIDNPSEKIEIIHRTGISAENKMMNKTQQYGSVSTYSHRYLLQHTFGIVDNELEPDNEKFYDNKKQPTPKQNNNENNSCISENQRQELKKIVDEKGISIEKVKGLLNQYGIPSSHEIPKTKYNEIVDKLERLS